MGQVQPERHDPPALMNEPVANDDTIKPAEIPLRVQKRRAEDSINIR